MHILNSSGAFLNHEQRADILNREVARLVSMGWAAESVTQTQAVLFKARRIGWFWNLIFTLVTGGFWAIIWIIRILVNKGKRIVLFVDEFGNIEKR